MKMNKQQSTSSIKYDYLEMRILDEFKNTCSINGDVKKEPIVVYEDLPEILGIKFSTESVALDALIGFFDFVEPGLTVMRFTLIKLDNNTRQIYNQFHLVQAPYIDGFAVQLHCVAVQTEMSNFFDVIDPTNTR